MSKFKVGDKVKVTLTNSEYNIGNLPVGYEFKISELYKNNNGDFWYREQIGIPHGVSAEALQLINEPKKTNKTIMKTLSNYIKKTLDSDTQALVKAGYLNGDLEPTSKTEEAIKEIQFFALKDQLVERAKKEIEEEEKSK